MCVCGGGGGVIAPIGEKLLFEHTKFSATRGGVITPTTHPPLDPPLGYIFTDQRLFAVYAVNFFF